MNAVFTTAVALHWKEYPHRWEVLVIAVITGMLSFFLWRRFDRLTNDFKEQALKACGPHNEAPAQELKTERAETRCTTQHHFTSKTDPAALAIATAAGAIAVSLEDGPYDAYSLVVGITLLAVICGYDWENQRTRNQSFALACSISFCSMLIVGFFVDCGYMFTTALGLTTPLADTAFDGGYFVFVWLVFAISFYFHDEKQQLAQN